jgi:single-strand DNA-binding protein
MLQKVTIMGFLGVDPEMRYSPKGDAVTSFSVATSKKYTDANGQKVENTTWFRVSAWGKQAETCNQYLKKGSGIYIEGELLSDPATGGPKMFTRRDGTPGASFEVKLHNFTFLPKGGDKQTSQETDDGEL